MASSWITFPIEGEDFEGMCIFDIGIAEGAPYVDRPLCSLVRVAFKDPGEHGMGDPDERERLAELEETLESRLSKACNATLFATVRGGGGLDIWLYAAAGSDDIIHDTATEVFEGYEIEGGSNEDPVWAQYSAMYPDDDQERWGLDAQLVQQLATHEDNLAAERPVEHTAYFPDETTAQGYAEAATREGFEVMITEQAEENDETGLPFVVSVVRNDAVEIDSIFPVTSFLNKLAAENDGIYDGWETPVVTGEAYDPETDGTDEEDDIEPEDGDDSGKAR